MFNGLFYVYFKFPKNSLPTDEYKYEFLSFFKICIYVFI